MDHVIRHKTKWHILSKKVILLFSCTLQTWKITDHIVYDLKGNLFDEILAKYFSATGRIRGVLKCDSGTLRKMDVSFDNKREHCFPKCSKTLEKSCRSLLFMSPPIIYDVLNENAS